jgi:predicted transposase YdaD
VAKPFDVSTKYLIETYPEAWLSYVGLVDTGPVEVIDADLSTVIAEADKVLRLRQPEPWLVHIEFQASADPTLERRLLQYNAVLGNRYEVPVQSIVVLLRPRADHPRMSGILRQHLPRGQQYVDFRYLVIRAWEQPVDAILAGGLGTLPLAPMADVSEAELPSIVHRMGERIRSEASPDEAATLWTSTYVLMGLRYPPGLAEQILRGVRGMRESSTYQVILAEGRVEGRVEGRIEEAREILLRQGRKRFGPADDRVQSTIRGISSRERLEELSERLLDVTTWQDLLADQ